MKIHKLLFVLMLALSAKTGLQAQTPDATTTTTSVTAFANVPNANAVRLNSGNFMEYHFYIFASDFAVPATDVVLTINFPVQVGYVYAGDGANCIGSNPTSNSRELTIVTCNLGNVPRGAIDYSKLIRIVAFPQFAGAAIVTGTIKGTNTASYSFTNTVTILPEKSRKRIRFL